MNTYSKRMVRRQRGIAAVELALIMMLTGFVMPVIFLFARVFYHYNVIKQATQDAANFMASVPRIELKTSAGMAAAQARSRELVRNGISEAGITPPEDLIIDVRCNNNSTCSWATEVQDVRVEATFILVDGFWQDTGPWLSQADGSAWELRTSSTAIYQN
jgi:Flp pilus assembly protein TadG